MVPRKIHFDEKTNELVGKVGKQESGTKVAYIGFGASIAFAFKLNGVIGIRINCRGNFNDVWGQKVFINHVMNISIIFTIRHMIRQNCA